MEYYRDIDIDFVIDVNYGIGKRFTYKGCKCISVYNGEFPRSAEFEITSLKNIGAVGAVHHYGNILIPGLYFKFLTIVGEEKKYHDKGDIVNIIGGVDKCKPKSMCNLKIEITRKITQTDLRNKYRWGGYDAGDNTNAFCSEDYLILHAKRSFKKIFGPGWKLITMDLGSDEEIEIILAETK